MLDNTNASATQTASLTFAGPSNTTAGTKGPVWGSIYGATGSIVNTIANGTNNLYVTSQQSIVLSPSTHIIIPSTKPISGSPAGAIIISQLFNGTGAGAINFANYGYAPPLSQGQLTGCIKADLVNGMGIYAFNTNPLRIDSGDGMINISAGSGANNSNSANVATFSSTGLTMGTNNGIQFNNTGANTNSLLNWYETGTYTTGWTYASGTANRAGGYTTTIYYTRIGNVVTWQWRCSCTTSGQSLSWNTQSSFFSLPYQPIIWPTSGAFTWCIFGNNVNSFGSGAHFRATEGTGGTAFPTGGSITGGLTDVLFTGTYIAKS
jgi:hypothetical protein